MKRKVRTSLGYSIAGLSGVLATLVCFVSFELVSLLAIRDATLRGGALRDHLVRKARARIEQPVKSETQRLGGRARSIGASQFSQIFSREGVIRSGLVVISSSNS